MLSLSGNNQTNIVEAFNSTITYMYLDDLLCGTWLYRFLTFAPLLTLLNIDYPYFEQMVGQTYPT